MEISIKYLVPILAILDNKNYFCMVDYSFGNLYFLNEPEDSEKKKILEKEILRKIDTVAVRDIKEVDISKNIINIVNDIENNDIIKKYSVNVNLEEENKEVEEIPNEE